MTILYVGIDLAKNVFAVHGVDETGKVVLRRPSVKRRNLRKSTTSTREQTRRNAHTRCPPGARADHSSIRQRLSIAMIFGRARKRLMSNDQD